MESYWRLRQPTQTPRQEYLQYSFSTHLTSWTRHTCQDTAASSFKQYHLHSLPSVPVLLSPSLDYAKRNLHFIGKLFWYWLTLKTRSQKIIRSYNSSREILNCLYKLHLLNYSDNQCFGTKQNFNTLCLCLKFWIDSE